MDVLPFRSRALCHGRGDCCSKRRFCATGGRDDIVSVRELGPAPCDGLSRQLSRMLGVEPACLGRRGAAVSSDKSWLTCSGLP